MSKNWDNFKCWYFDCVHYDEDTELCDICARNVEITNNN